MKKAKSDGLRAEYKRSDFKKLERGNYYERVKASSNVVVLEPDVAAAFPNSAAVNKALHSLVEVAEASTSVPAGPPDLDGLPGEPEQTAHAQKNSERDGRVSLARTHGTNGSAVATAELLPMRQGRAGDQASSACRRPPLQKA